MLFRTNILALIGGGENPKYDKKKLVLWDDKDNKVMTELKFSYEVLNVKLKKDRIFVVCEEKIYVFLFTDFSNTDNITTCKNPKGIIAVSGSADITVAAYLGENKGEVVLRDFTNESAAVTINAHENDIACIGISSDGGLIATGSEKGTIIRIFKLGDESGKHIQEVRRGTDKAEIYSLAFDKDSSFLACSSDRGTIHIFALKGSSSTEENGEKADAVPKNTTSMLRVKLDGESYCL